MASCAIPHLAHRRGHRRVLSGEALDAQRRIVVPAVGNCKPHEDANLASGGPGVLSLTHLASTVLGPCKYAIRTRLFGNPS
jgi:hypothetical protein